MPLKITILGMGAIGASLGLALGTLDPKELASGRPTITGWDANKRALNDARGRLAIDAAEADLEVSVRDADVVFVCVPFEQMRDVFTRIGPVLKHGSIVTDTSEAKVQTGRWATELIPVSSEYIGGHPLVAIGGSSIRDVNPDGFKDSVYCLVPLPRTRQNALDTVEALIVAIGAKPYYIDAAEHDSYVAAAGHLPLAVSVALMRTVGMSGGWREIMPIAGEGLVTMTQFASGEPRVNAEILTSNADALDGWIERTIAALRDLQREMRDPAALESSLEEIQGVREEWQQSRPGTRPGEDAFHGDMQEVVPMNLSGMLFGRRPSQRNGKNKK